MTKPWLRLPVAAAVLLIAGVGLAPAVAQNAADPTAPTPPDVQQNAPTLGAGNSGSLSDQLDRSNGVIAPSSSAANTDPGIVKPSPDAGTTTTMPVVPPPGTPENAPNVKPK